LNLVGPTMLAIPSADAPTVVDVVRDIKADANICGCGCSPTKRRRLLYKQSEPLCWSDLATSSVSSSCVPSSAMPVVPNAGAACMVLGAAEVSAGSSDTLFALAAMATLQGLTEGIMLAGPHAVADYMRSPLVAPPQATSALQADAAQASQFPELGPTASVASGRKPALKRRLADGSMPHCAHQRRVCFAESVVSEVLKPSGAVSLREYAVEGPRQRPWSRRSSRRAVGGRARPVTCNLVQTHASRVDSEDELGFVEWWWRTQASDASLACESARVGLSAAGGCASVPPVSHLRQSRDKLRELVAFRPDVGYDATARGDFDATFRRTRMAATQVKHAAVPDHSKALADQSKSESSAMDVARAFHRALRE